MARAPEEPTEFQVETVERLKQRKRVLDEYFKGYKVPVRRTDLNTEDPFTLKLLFFSKFQYIRDPLIDFLKSVGQQGFIYRSDLIKYGSSLKDMDKNMCENLLEYMIEDGFLCEYTIQNAGEKIIGLDSQGDAVMHHRFKKTGKNHSRFNPFATSKEIIQAANSFIPKNR